MWYLTLTNPPQKIYFIGNSKITTIGRKNCNINFENDLSLSRRHANLKLIGDILYIQDDNSKYGTFMNKSKLTLEVCLKDGDRIHFGRFDSEIQVHQLVVKPSTSMLDQEKRKKLENILRPLQISFADFDSTCTHLTMPVQTSVSLKLLQALVTGVAIVSTKFWPAFLYSVENNKILPKHVDFLPIIKEELFVTPNSISLAINENRKKLFAGKTFIFVSTNEMQAYEAIVKSAGGKCLSMTKRVTITQCCAKNSIVIQSKDSATQSVNEDALLKIKNALAKKKLRMVPETEIGLAVMNVSLERWCNPENTSVVSLFFDHKLKPTTSKTLVPESIDTDEPSETRKSDDDRIKSTQGPVVVVNLDSDEEVDENVNKENVPSFPLTEQSIIETQNLVEVEIPETQETTKESELSVKKINRTTNSNEISIDAQTNPPTTVISKEQEDIVQHCSSFPDPFVTSLIEHASSNSSTKPSESSVFNFSNSSIRKRKNSETDPIDQELRKISANEPIQKRGKIFSAINDGSDEDYRQSSKAMTSRKRTSDDSVGGLFAFKTKFTKRQKQAVTDTQNISVNSLRKHQDPLQMQTLTQSHDELDTGVWLSKVMSSDVEENFDEAPLSDITEDLKPPNLPTLFDIVTSNAISTISSIVFKRKQFVKKNNYKPQSTVIEMKCVKVEDMKVTLEIF